ncbi:hypothetical protein NRF20_20715 [Streptomyces sp. R-74717]|uniref:DUF6907 domain-containing protein n=1 Tax=Streptomyces sp. R-74717 TaxID=2969820 RepID=UPI0039B6D265
MQNTVPASFKPSGGIVAQRVAEQSADAWRSMTLGTVATTPINELLQTLGVRIVEVEQGKLAADGIVGYFTGRVGDAEIQIERNLPQADREPIVRDLLARISPAEQTYAKRAKLSRPLRPAAVSNGIVHVECYEWCTHNHLDPELNLEDVYHSSDSATVWAPRVAEDPQPLLHARLNADSFGTAESHRQPLVVIDDEADSFSMTPAQALEFADKMVAFAEEIRAMAAQAAR